MCDCFLFETISRKSMAAADVGKLLRSAPRDNPMVPALQWQSWGRLVGNLLSFLPVLCCSPRTFTLIHSLAAASLPKLLSLYFFFDPKRYPKNSRVTGFAFKRRCRTPHGRDWRARWRRPCTPSTPGIHPSCTVTSKVGLGGIQGQRRPMLSNLFSALEKWKNYFCRVRLNLRLIILKKSY